MNIGSPIEQNAHRRLIGEGRGQVQQRPAICRATVRPLRSQFGIVSEQFLQPLGIAHRSRLRQIQFKAGAEEVPDRGLAVVDRQKQSRDALGVPALGYLRLVFYPVCNPLGISTLDEIEKALAHSFTVAAATTGAFDGGPFGDSLGATCVGAGGVFSPVGLVRFE